MTKRIAVIQGHPDAAGHHLLNAMADAYAEAATQAGHQVRQLFLDNSLAHGSYLVDGRAVAHSVGYLGDGISFLKSLE